MFLIPGRSYRGSLPPLTATEAELSKHLSDHVHMLAGDIGARSLTSAPDGLEKAALYIEHVLAKHGYFVERQEFPVEMFSKDKREIKADNIVFASVELKTWNVIAELIGTGKPSEIVVVGAHYDSVYDCPAANDNGTGVAAILEIARLLKGERLERTVRFVAFTNEEPPFFRSDKMGSYQYANRCHDRREKITAMISVETIGYYDDDPNTQEFPHPLFGSVFPNTGNFLAFVSNLRSAPLMRQCIGAFRNAVKFPSEGVALPALVTGISLSDHYNFWRFDYPAIMVTDTAFLRYPHYHEPEDTPDKINYEKLARVVSGLTAVVRDLCS